MFIIVVHASSVDSLKAFMPSMTSSWRSLICWYSAGTTRRTAMMAKLLQPEAM